MMEEPSPTDPKYCYQLQCAVTVQNNNLNTGNGKKFHAKKATVMLGRNEYRDILVNISYPLHNCRVHYRFAKEGRGGISVQDQHLDILMSNCPPERLNIFLKTLSAKLELLKKLKLKEPSSTRMTPSFSAKSRLMSDLPTVFAKLSPLTLVEMHSLRPNLAKQTQPLADASNRLNHNPNTPNKGKRALSSTTPTRVGNAANMKKRRLDQNVPAPMKSGSLSITLSLEQKRVLRTVLAGQSVFFTGAAGTGKSLLLGRIIGSLPADTTFVTATTGVAACHIGGVTLHSFAGIGDGRQSLAQSIQLATRPTVLQQWLKCTHLVIDEVSMIDSQLFTLLENVARAVRRQDRPFGGIQLVLCGDFLQLPPVAKMGEQKSFCFQSNAWDSCVNESIVLKQVRRQDDQRFVRILNEIRHGRCPQQCAAILENTRLNQLDTGGILATRLCTHKADADRINTQKLHAITAESREFTCLDSEPLPASMDVGCPRKLQLKVGAQVMLTKNMDLSQQLSNGARGVITHFDTKTGHPVVRFVCGVQCAVKPYKHMVRMNGAVLHRAQLPLQLAWAISIHKSQGMSLDLVEISLARAFEDGQAYVALSRARSLNGLKVIDFDRTCIRANQMALQFYEHIETLDGDY